jgi:aryl-alcohol dehydrogenase-like predicted oxidoreductase
MVGRREDHPPRISFGFQGLIMDKRPLGTSGFDVAPLVLGGNVFGWTIDERASFAVLDAFVDHGFDAIDTADVYSRWADGNEGGESEAIIGRWLRANPGKRDKVVVFTKVGSDMGGPERKGLSERWIMTAVEDSLRRLGVERIDLYFSHWPDAEATHEATLGAYDKLMRAGKVRAIGASNYDAALLGEALAVADAKGLPRYTVLQPEYNLYARDGFPPALRDLCLEQGIGVVTYFSLAAGFLTGKYRSAADLDQSARGSGMGKYLNERGRKVLAALDAVAERHATSQAAVALAWLMASDGVTAPIASATRPEHVATFATAAALRLGGEDMALLDAAGD